MVGPVRDYQYNYYFAAVILSLSLLIMCATVKAEDQSGPLEIRIEKVVPVIAGGVFPMLGGISSVALTMKGDSLSIRNLWICLAYPTKFLKLEKISPGNLVDSNYFDCTAPDTNQDGVISFECKARDKSPVMLGSAPDTLFVFDFRPTNNLTYQCEFFPVSFYWQDCDDNSVVYAVSDSLVNSISRVVYSAEPMVHRGYSFEGYSMVKYDIPNYWGADDNCRNISDSGRIIDFYNGGILVSNDPCCCDMYGDLNLNGIIDEKEDVELFYRALFGDTGIFKINIVGQSSASDVDNDGHKLWINDLVLLCLEPDSQLKIMGQDKKVGEAEFGISDKEGVISIAMNSDVPVGGVYFEFRADSNSAKSDYDISPGPRLDRMDTRFGITADTLKITIAPLRDSAKCRDCYLEPGEYKLLDIQYPGRLPEIITVRASDIYGRLAKTSLNYEK